MTFIKDHYIRNSNKQTIPSISKKSSIPRTKSTNEQKTYKSDNLLKDSK